MSNLQSYFVIDTIYLWINIGVLPFWLIIFLTPSSRINQILINSFFLPLILSSVYIYIVYKYVFFDQHLFNIFDLYWGLDELYTLFSEESFLLLFWIHFLSINLFVGSWVSRDGIKYGIPKWIMFLPLLLIYLTGPVGFFLYWLIRVFFSRKIILYD